MSPKKKLYLDIDGVLLTKKNTKASEYSSEFIKFIVENFECFWLTTHCKGDTTPTINYISKYFNERTIENLKSIKATTWVTLKTEAIDFFEDFVWIDDFPLNAEKIILNENSKLNKLIIVNLDNKDELKNITKFLSIH